MTRAPLLTMTNIGKSFPGVRALDGVSFDVASGEIHALVGENGAGKSTLIKILGGVYPQGEYDGTISIAGTPQPFRGIRDAEKAGVAVVFQELSLVPELSIAENMFLGRLPSRAGAIRWNDLYMKASSLQRELDFGSPADTPVHTLGIGQQQLVEIAKALSHEAQILVLDEPTAALNEAESQSLFRILRRLRERGLGLIYISHRLDEVLELADRITVLRDGRSVVTKKRGEMDRKQMVAAMIGREISQVFPEPQRTAGDKALEVRNLSVQHPVIPGRRVLSDISFEVHAGEVVGIAGLLGSGRTALLNVLFGVFPKPYSGTVLVAGQDVSISNPGDAIASGMAFVTEDRKKLALSLNASIGHNMSLAALPRFAMGPLLMQQRETLAVEGMMRDLRVKATSPETAVGTLSGGNQQKVVLGRWLMNKPRVLLLDEPTRGIDIGAKQEIYGRIDALAKQGLALLVVSSEMEELRGICDRILVMHEGRITGRFNRPEATAEAIMMCATGSMEAV